MANLALSCPSEEELADAIESLGTVLDLDDYGEIDLSPYLTRLLLQLEEILSTITLQTDAEYVYARTEASPT